MLLNTKTMEDGSIVSYYDSSNIPKSVYYPNDKVLNVYFNSGKIYSYSNVNEALFAMFSTSDSQGKFLNSNLKKDDIPYTLLNEVFNMESIKEELNELNTSEQIVFKDLILEKIRNFESLLEKTSFDELIDDLSKTIGWYNKKRGV